MVESTRQVQTRDPFDRFDEAINDPRLYETYERTELAPYGRNQLATSDPTSHEPVPLFLSDYEDDRYQESSEYTFANGGRRKLSPARILTAVVVAAVAAGALALFSTDSTRSVIVNAKASLASAAPVSFGSAQPDAAPPQQPRVAAISPVAPEAPAPAVPDAQAARRAEPGALASASPSREEITAAYQTAIKGRVVALEPAVREPSPPAAPAARRIDPDELAMLLKRAKGLLAVGDIISARLLLERAADAQEAEAALMLAGTYDPQVLGVQDMRSVTADPAMARSWYQKAAQLGSADAQRRLAQLR
jgi:TPR repeat protein